jgi:hypothetical protein
VATVSDYGVPRDDLARFCGTLNRGYLPPEQFVDTVRYAPQVIVERPDFVPFLQVQIGNGITGLALFDVIHPQLTAYAAPREVFSPSYVLTDQYIPQTVRTYYAQAQVNPGFTQQPAFIPQPAFQQPVAQQPVYVPAQPAYARQQQERFRRQAPNVARSVQQPVVIQSPQVVHIPPGQAKKEARQAQAQVSERVHGQGHGKGRQQVVQQPVVVVPPPMASAAPPAPVMVAPPPHDNGHGKGPGGQGPPGQQKDKEKGGKGHGKD